MEYEGTDMIHARTLYKRYTQAQLVAMEKAIREDPASRKPPGSFGIYTSKALLRMDLISWAIRMHTEDRDGERDLELLPRTRAQIEAEIAKLQTELANLPREPERVWGVRKPGDGKCDLITPTRQAAARAIRDGCKIIEFVEVMK